ncbi:MAG: glycoside hydrolase family 130 protein [Planctomycetota bacterium]|jgi:predicted GH43/DUF377 family glycosyl hydrolase
MSRQASPLATEAGVDRTSIRIHADPSRVIARFFLPGGEERAGPLLDMVRTLEDREVTRLLNEVREHFAARHRDLDAVFDEHYLRGSRHLDRDGLLDGDRRLLAGAYFTFEYSFESVSLFNPSMVPHPDQTGLPDGWFRFLMSLRSCGEGHVSSMVFRTGVIDDACAIHLDLPSRFAAAARPVEGERYHRRTFRQGLKEMGAWNATARGIVKGLDETFSLVGLERAVRRYRTEAAAAAQARETLDSMLWLAHSSYHIDFPGDVEIGERVIFPVTEHESRGVEDARFVLFQQEDGRSVYYGTYTAHDGFRAVPRLIRTDDFRRFRVQTLHGRCVQDKGLALFPRKINGRYAMVSRIDGESLYFMPSDNLHFWNEATRVEGPVEPWEFMMIGNCGSPIETREGWVLLTHGVGPMRQYCLGAMLLDGDDPSRVIARLKEPLLVPPESQRDGYVPNVVYTCGALRHAGRLFVPYGVSDSMTSIAVVKIEDLLRRFEG